MSPIDYTPSGNFVVIKIEPPIQEELDNLMIEIVKKASIIFKANQETQSFEN